jgi:hypothetical protein
VGKWVQLETEGRKVGTERGANRGTGLGLGFKFELWGLGFRA